MLFKCDLIHRLTEINHFIYSLRIIAIYKGALYTIFTMKKVTIYTTPTCPYCIRAKGLLDSLNVTYDEIDVVEYPEERDRIMNDFNWRTVPAIFIADELVGGFDDINALHEEGKLLEMING